MKESPSSKGRSVGEEGEEEDSEGPQVALGTITRFCAVKHIDHLCSKGGKKREISIDQFYHHRVSQKLKEEPRYKEHLFIWTLPKWDSTTHLPPFRALFGFFFSSENE